MIDLNIQKALNGALGRLDLELNIQIVQGTFLCLYGKSGAGKTSTLKILAGLLPADSGLIKRANETWFDTNKGIHLAPQKRNLGFVFQDFALFPHLTVRQNLVFASSKKDPQKRIEKLLQTMELNLLQHKKPHQLSGGQQQRVALARALVQKPRILLLDEPLSALDQNTRTLMQKTLAAYHKEQGLTTIMVSHDQQEIIRLADRLIQIEAGKIIFDGSPSEAFSNPNTSKPIQLQATVIACHYNEKESCIKALLQSEVLHLECSATQALKYQKGDSIAVQIKENRFVIP